MSNRAQYLLGLGSLCAQMLLSSAPRFGPVALALTFVAVVYVDRRELSRLIFGRPPFGS